MWDSERLLRGHRRLAVVVQEGTTDTGCPLNGCIDAVDAALVVSAGNPR